MANKQKKREPRIKMWFTNKKKIYLKPQKDTKYITNDKNDAICAQHSKEQGKTGADGLERLEN